jgi:hypothetical protein
MTEKILDDLVKENQITGYEYETIDEESRRCYGHRTKPWPRQIGASDFRNTERLILKFPNGKKLKIDTFCSGCNENTSMIFSNVP